MEKNKNTAAIARTRLLFVLHEDRVRTGRGKQLMPGVTMVVKNMMVVKNIWRRLNEC